MKKLKYIGGKVIGLEVTLNKVYEVYILNRTGEEINIVDDFWLKKGFNKESMISEGNYCYVNEEELENCFEVVE